MESVTKKGIVIIKHGKTSYNAAAVAKMSGAAFKRTFPKASTSIHNACKSAMELDDKIEEVVADEVPEEETED